MQLTRLNCFSQNAWTQKANFGGTERGGAIGFSIGLKGYIGTGTNFDGTNSYYYKLTFLTSPNRYKHLIVNKIASMIA